ncbi:MAG: UDP-N-acetylmuramoyl-tripeptide--D-alanyl-D-alanine ligase, partial [Anaerolineales bacterium]
MILLEDLLAGTNGRLVRPASAQTFSDFAYDSRQAEPGQLFVAVKSDKGDGHDFIPQAIARGVTGILCQRLPEGDHSVTTVVVSDTQVALRDYAAHVIRKSGVEVVGVTGSAGKTSTKEMIAAVLATRNEVFRNFGSYNGRYGLPIALARMEPQHRIAVLEMACDGFGEIGELVRIAPPRVGVVTNVSENQIAFFGSLEAIAREHGALVEALPKDGLAVLNQDDALVRALARRSLAPVTDFGVGGGAGLRATGMVSDLTGTTFRLHSPEGELAVALKLLGVHQAANALAALSVAR